MKFSKAILISIMFRISVILFCVLVLYGNYLIGQKWFSLGQSPTDIHNAVKNALDVNALNEEEMTGLMFAAKFNNVQLAESLIKAGADPNIQTQLQGGFTALIMAISNGNYERAREIIDLLLENNANVRLRSYGTDRRNSGNTAMQFTSYIDTNFDAFDAGGGRIHDARRMVADKVMKHGGNINDQNDAGNTLAHLTVQQRNLPFMRDMKEYFGHMLDLNLKNKDGQTVKDFALSYNYTEMIPIIDEPVKMIEQVGERDKNGMTGLMSAIAVENMDLVTHWLEKGANVNAATEDQYKYAPLMLAIMHEQVPMVEELLKRGADRLQKDARGNIAVMHVFRIVDMPKRMRLIKMLLEKNPKEQLKMRDALGNTVLHEAVIARDERLIQYLLDTYGLDAGVKMKNGFGQTPYELAKKLKHTDIAQTLQRITFQ